MATFEFKFWELFVHRVATLVEERINSSKYEPFVTHVDGYEGISMESNVFSSNLSGKSWFISCDIIFVFNDSL